MNQAELNELNKKHQVIKHTKRNCIIAFISGGLVSIVGQFIHDLLLNVVSKENAVTLTIFIFIFLAAIFTGLGLYDKVAKHAGAGLFVPITGFSNALTSSALECKHEGLIYGIGSNMFKLAGSVITYGIVSAILLSLITYGIRLL